MEVQEGKYNIKAASLLLGIQPGTLRAWERRYQMIAPVRNELGHRLYTEDHINILKWLIKKVDKGFTISQAISLMDHSPSYIEIETVYLKQGNQLTRLSDELYDALIHFDELHANEMMNTLLSLFTIEKVMTDVFTPLVAKIGDFFKAGKIINAQKYFVTSFLSTRITMMIHNLPSSTYVFKAVMVCCPSEGLDIGLLMFIFYLRRRGIEVVNIGANREEVEIDKVIKTIHPDLLFMSCSIQENINKTLSLVTKVALNHKEITMGLVGESLHTMGQSEKDQFSGLIVGQTPNEWEKWLMEQMRMM